MKRENEINTVTKYISDDKLKRFKEWTISPNITVLCVNEQYFTNEVKLGNIGENHIETQFNRIENILFDSNQRIKNIENYIQRLQESLTTIPILLPRRKEENKEFYEREDWILKQKSKYPNEFIAFTKKDDGWKVITHSPLENDLLKEIDELIKKKEINPSDKIIIRRI